MVVPDPKYKNTTVSRFINVVMKEGKKAVAERIVYKCFDIMAEKTGKPALEVFQKAMDNARPLLEIKPRRIGGATYQVPVEVRRDRRYALAMRWIITYSTARSGNTMAQKLAAELMAASKGEGSAVKKKEDTHRMAEANRAFAHFSR